jgi:hypothetical protein
MPDEYRDFPPAKVLKELSTLRRNRLALSSQSEGWRRDAHLLPIWRLRLSSSSLPCNPSFRHKPFSKRYASGFEALKQINLDIHRGEIFCATRPQWRRKNDTDWHHLRHPGEREAK